MVKIFTYLAMGLCLCIATLSPAAGANETQKWAILSSSDVQDSGVADLLMAALSQQTGVETVERDQLNLATVELERDQQFSSVTQKRRLQLGKRLQADMLLIVWQTKDSPKSGMTWMIAECRRGIRLRSDSCRLFADPGVAVSEIVTSVQSCRQQYADGVHQLIAVPPFLSKDLVHTHDHLQYGLASILNNALLRVPGVAVVELQEARAIAAEVGRVESVGRSSIRCVFVEAEYKTNQPHPVSEGNSSLQIQLEIFLSNGFGNRESLEKWDGRSDLVVNYLQSTAVDQILDSSQATQTISIVQQKQELVARATLFSELGAYHESIPLKEAAVLLNPDDEVLRTSLVADLQILAFSQYTRHRRSMSPDERIRQQIEFFRRTVPHVEWLMHRQCLSILDSALIVSNFVGLAQRNCQPGTAELRQELDRFFWSIFDSVTASETLVSNRGLTAEVHRAIRSSEIVASGAATADIRSRASQRSNWMMIAIKSVFRTIPKSHLVRDPQRGGDYLPSDDHQTLISFFQVAMSPHAGESPERFVLSALLDNFRGTLIESVASKRFRTDELAELADKFRTTETTRGLLYADCIDLSLVTWISSQAGRSVSAADLLERVSGGLKKCGLQGHLGRELTNIRNTLGGGEKIGRCRHTAFV